MTAGELFAIPLGDAGFVTGHVLLNVRAEDTRALLSPRSRLREHGSLLLDVHGVGRGDLLGEDAMLFTLSPKIELRYSPHRDEVYRAIGADPNRSYWDCATAEGLDPGRLWRN